MKKPTENNCHLQCHFCVLTDRKKAQCDIQQFMIDSNLCLIDHSSDLSLFLYIGTNLIQL